MNFTRFVWEAIQVNRRLDRRKLTYQALSHVTEIMLVLVVIWLSLSTASFFKLNNIMNVLRSGAI